MFEICLEYRILPRFLIFFFAFFLQDRNQDLVELLSNCQPMRHWKGIDWLLVLENVIRKFYVTLDFCITDQVHYYNFRSGIRISNQTNFQIYQFFTNFFALPQILKNGSLPVPSYNPNYSVQSPYSTINVNSLPIIFIC